ncbi:MAG TPA: DJ-1/PfpI family protein [Myxococcota bacterium]|nr:DJ-1/PfpI family protein [Myxococcota bacterium]
MRLLRIALAGVAVLAAAGIGAALLALPAARPRAAALPEISEAERAAVVAQLRPPKRARPLVAVFAANGGTETTDFVVPLGVLRASHSADVLAVALQDAPVELHPALRVRPDLDVAAFDARYGDGADYVIVPALHDAKEPAALAWLQAQARKGATMVGICDGGWVLGAAGLLDGRAATSHWLWVSRMPKTFPGMTWVTDRRYVVDRGVATTTGISASIPLSLTLVEAIAGPERAAEVAREFGVPGFGAGHVSRDFALDRPAVFTAARNLLAFWKHETLELELRDGVDEVAVALAADAWQRTYRASVRTLAPEPEVRSRRGLRFLADATGTATHPIALPAAGSSTVDAVLRDIDARYGAPTADFVALQLEYEPPVKPPAR